MDAAHPPATESVDRIPLDDDRHVAYAEYGDPTGLPVVFLHGTPGSHRLGRLFHAAARRESVRLLAVDRPGYGQSSPWPERDLTDTGAFVRPVLDDAGVSRAGVVGFSGGGPHALALAATHADRVTAVDIVSGATPPTHPPRAPPIQRLLERVATTAPTLLRGLIRGQAWLADHVSPTVVVSQYTSSAGRAALPDEVLALVARDFVDGVSPSGRGATTEFRLLGDSWPFSLDSVDAPVRLWHGADDANVPVDGVRLLRDRLPNAQLTVFETADHLTTLYRSRASVVQRHADGSPR